MKILITGTAGFIGFHLAKKLLDGGNTVVGMDNINDYYDQKLKFARLAETGIEKAEIEWNKPVKSHNYPKYTFYRTNLEDREAMGSLFREEQFDRVVHLAAQAGVRYSLENPHAYINCNLVGFMNILESCRHNAVKHLVYASSSSIYGLNKSMPFSVHDNVDHPVSLYAATKKSNELMAHTYSHLYGLPTTGLRFFTVYGPWGRPDMALFIFTEKIMKGEQIDVYNHGKMERDFTYIDDIIEGVIRVLNKPPEGNSDWDPMQPDPATSPAPYKMYDIGNNNPVKLMDFVHAIEEATGKKAKINYMPIQPGDVEKTWADVKDLIQHFGYKPDTEIEEGVRRFVEWYQEGY
ncbi:MAG: NAD-dependent epimerase [Bacteroidales bacterium]|nr:NAD-dependent epimerase [Bacteroidales bacterium]